MNKYYLALKSDRSISFTLLVVGIVCVWSIVNVTYVWNGIAQRSGSLYIKSCSFLRFFFSFLIYLLQFQLYVISTWTPHSIHSHSFVDKNDTLKLKAKWHNVFINRCFNTDVFIRTLINLAGSNREQQGATPHTIVCPQCLKQNRKK